MSGNSLRYCDGCGARLARDNPGRWCSPCQQKARDLVSCPPQVPDEFWDAEPLRAAFAARHIGQVIRAYRHHSFHGRSALSQDLVAGWLRLAQAQLSRIERGSPVSDLRKLVEWAQTLAIPARCLWFDLPGQRRGGPEAVAPEGARAVEAVVPAEQLSDAGLIPDGDAMMVWLPTTIDGRFALVPVRLPRRRVLAAGGGLLGALAGLCDPDEAARVTAAIMTPRRADMATVRHLEALLTHYRRLDDQLGPRDLLTPVRSTLELVDVLRSDARPPTRQALLSLSAQYQQEIGWLWEDSGDHAKAERAYDRAIDRATEANDHALACHVRSGKSCLARSEGRVDTALELAQAAQRGEGLTPAVLGYATSREARALALVRKPYECKRKLEESAALLAESAANAQAGEPAWIYYFTEGQLEADHGNCLTDLGEAAKAIEIFDRAIPRLPIELVRDRAYHLAEQARAHERNHDPEQAGVVGQEAARIVIRTGSGRILTKLQGLHARLSETHNDVQAVQELGELLRPPLGSR